MMLKRERVSSFRAYLDGGLYRKKKSERKRMEGELELTKFHEFKLVIRGIMVIYSEGVSGHRDGGP
jgi:hypothetical protein